ncbi:MAG TPA: DUF2924 domain-containing protein [Tianweitania sediminis]|jgi:hypothetical protein|nr:DUF2924 domain-containing protein [Tianweitania sediminis]
MIPSAKVAQELDSLGEASRDDLVNRWECAYGCSPPPGVRRELLIYAAAWQIQVKRLGGFSAVTKRLLSCEVERIKNSVARVSPAAEPGIVASGMPVDDANGKDAGTAVRDITSVVRGRRKPPPSARRRLSPGARLIREWHGRTYVVDVTDGGVYLFAGREHRSLTAIALEITGVQWSGPRFFGL